MINKDDYYFDGRGKVRSAVSSKDIKPGDVVLEGEWGNCKYRVITAVNDKKWEYFDPTDGYYHETNPEYCHYLVKGQPNANGKLVRIIFVI